MAGDRYFKYFKEWVTTSITIKALAHLANASESTLTRHFDVFLTKPPRAQKLRAPMEIYLKADGTYLRRWGCALAFKAGAKVIFWDFIQRENYFRYCLDFSQIQELGYIIKGVTSDWHGSIVAAVKSTFPDIPHQRCLVHARRLCESLLTKHPETAAGQNLLELVKELTHIRTKAEKVVWLKWLERFEKRYGEVIDQRTYAADGRHWWFTHRNVRKAFRTLKTTTDHLFLYLDYPDLTSNTNCLEAEFTHLKQKLKIHNGLKRSRRVYFTHWYFYFKSL